ncbi:hypothetical protein BX666DRAFT_2020286 [Dichotomocladium elegans]|nr:hypothetical protein BX666DRAFT_2020286 [Dichotomocladium elegans]
MAPTTSTRRKRTLLNFNQLAILQHSFAKNPLPDNAVRAKLAIDLGVTERTVQIWFQNRRAKTRKSSKELLAQQNVASGPSENPQQRRSLPSGGRYQPTFRTLMTPERYEELRDRRRPRATLSSSSKPPLPNPEIASGVTLSFMAHMLRIGTWTRFAKHTATPKNAGGSWDLACEVDPFLRRIVWQIQVQDGNLFRMQIPFEAIRQIRLSNAYDDLCLADLEFDLFNPALVVFTMLRREIDLDWVLCSDFSEECQATQCFVHVLQGYYEIFNQTLLNLITLVPEFASTVIFATPPVCRDTLTSSPSATPEPYIATSNTTMTAMNYSTPIIYQQSYLQPHFLPLGLVEKPINPNDLYLIAATGTYF